MDDRRFAPPPEDSLTDVRGDLEAGAPADAVETLRVEVEAQRREAAAAHDRYLRTLADFDNYRRRAGREREESRRQAQEEVLREILAVLDNFDRALAAETGSGNKSGFRAGVELIRRDFLKALERLGVRPFVAVGEPFDPLRHDAVARVERADIADPMVVEEAARGYLFHDRVLRPAQVVVAVEPEPPAGPGDVGEGDP